MAKFYGTIGFLDYVEDAPSVYREVLFERKYYGDVIRNSRRYERSDKLNDDLAINNEFSILADAYANENFHHMIFVEYMGTKWKITNVTVERPRLILSVGGVYNAESGPQA